MANTQATKKHYRQTLTRTLRNKSRKSRISTFMKKVRSGLENNLPQEDLRALLKQAQSEMDKGVRCGVLKKKTVSRHLSKLNGKIYQHHLEHS